MDIKVRHIENVTVLQLVDSLDISNAHQIRKALFDAISSESAQVVVNLQDLDFIDSSGLAALAQGLRRAREYEGNLCLCSMRSPVRLIFEMTRFDKVFEIFVTEEDAVLAAAGQY